MREDHYPQVGYRQIKNIQIDISFHERLIKQKEETACGTILTSDPPPTRREFPINASKHVESIPYSSTIPILAVTMAQEGGNVRVVCRFRPQNRIEEGKGGRSIVNISADEKSVKLDVSSQQKRKKQVESVLV